MKMNLKIGDKIVFKPRKDEIDPLTNLPYDDVIVREICVVRDTGYSWFYPEVPNKIFYSEDSNDPFFEIGWALVPA